MTAPLNVLVADDETIIAMGIETTLAKMGHTVVGRARTGGEAVTKAVDLSPDLVIMDVKMPDMDGIEASRRILAHRAVPIIILSAYSDSDLIARADAVGVSNYLVKPVTEADLRPALTIAISRFRQLHALEEEVGSLKEALRTRKLVERAKGILMDRKGLSEADAFKMLQQMSRNQNIPMAKLAESILTAHSLL